MKRPIWHSQGYHWPVIALSFCFASTGMAVQMLAGVCMFISRKLMETFIPHTFEEDQCPSKPRS